MLNIMKVITNNNVVYYALDLAFNVNFLFVFKYYYVQISSIQVQIRLNSILCPNK